MNNIKITVSWEYEDKYGGNGHGEETVEGNLFDTFGVLSNKLMEAVGRTEKHIKDFRDAEPLPDDEDEMESYQLAHS